MSIRFVPAGDLAVLVEFEGEVSSELRTRVRGLEMSIAAHDVRGVVETVLAFRSLLVYYDPRVVGYGALCDALAAVVPQAASEFVAASRTVEIPCCYDDPVLGCDAEAVAGKLGLSTAELVKLHSEAEYLVYFIGFAPGQPYLTGLPERLTIPRLDTPRTKTPAGSVAIGGNQACVYSVDSPGGFWVLGRTPLRIYDSGASDPVLLHPGDRIRFRPIDRREYDQMASAVAARTYQPVIS